MSNYIPTTTKRMNTTWTKWAMLKEAERHVTGYQMWVALGRPEAHREKVEHYARLALDVAATIRKGDVRGQQARARQVEADLAEAGFTA